MNRLLMISLLFVCSPAFPQQAPTFRGDSAHTCVCPASSAKEFHKIKCQFHTVGQILSAPVVADGVVYFGSNDHFLYAVDLASGAQKWKFETGSRIPSTPAVANGLLFLLSYDSNFYALDAATGVLKWKFKTAGEHRFSAKHIHGIEPAAETMPDPFDFFLSSPVVSDGRIYLGSSDNNIYALDAATGTLKWKFKTGDVVHASPAISGGTLFVGSWDTFFYALDAATGAEKWRFNIGQDREIFKQTAIHASPPAADCTA